MPSQVYTNHGEDEYRVVSRERNGALIFARPDFSGGEHEHPEAQVSILFKGSSASLLTHSETGRTVRARLVPESFSYIPPRQPHRLNWQSEGELLNLYVSDQSLREFADDRDFQPPNFEVAGHPDRAVYEIGRLLVDEFHSMGGLAPSMIDHAIYLIFRRLPAATERIPKGEASGLLSIRRLQPAIDTINGNPEKDFTLLDLARLCNSSVFHFARSFSARTGAAPFRLQRKLRLDKAEQLLLKTELSVGEVATAVGFENLPHFSRVFRTCFGCSPRAFRRLHSHPAPPS